MTMIGTKLAALPPTAKILEHKHQEALKDRFGFDTPAQDHFKYDLDGDGLCDVFEILSPTKHVRVVIDRANRTREEFCAPNLGQFGQPEIVRYYSKDSFRGGYRSDFERLDTKTGAVIGGTHTIQGDTLHIVFSNGTSHDEKLRWLSGPQYAELMERGSLSPNVGFSVLE